MDSLCARPGLESSKDFPSLWESRRPRESEDEVKLRHQQARLACQRCPVLGACERMVTDLEKRGIPIDGVVAARYSDVAYGSQWQGDVQVCCVGCGVKLIPQKLYYQRKDLEGRRRHRGEGLCSECYPSLARFYFNKEKQ